MQDMLPSTVPATQPNQGGTTPPPPATALTGGNEPPKRAGQAEIDASNAPLLEHLVELRTRLIHSLYAFLALFIVCYMFSKPIFNVLIWPYARVVGWENAKLQITHFLELLYVDIKLAAFGAVFVGFPWIAYQLYKFVAPGLYDDEKAAFRPYLIWSYVLFGLGALIVYFIIFPMVISFSEGTVKNTNVELKPKASEFLSLVMQLVLGFGICFQLPVIVTLLARAGVVDANGLVQFRRYAIVAIAAVSAVLSPPDPVSMLVMMAPTMALYEISILVVRRLEQMRGSKTETPA